VAARRQNRAVTTFVHRNIGTGQCVIAKRQAPEIRATAFAEIPARCEQGQNALQHRYEVEIIC
jgi:hypothetical protein